MKYGTNHSININISKALRYKVKSFFVILMFSYTINELSLQNGIWL